MKTDKNLKEFIEQLKNTSPEIPADLVKSLIDSGKPSPFVAKRSFQPRRIKQFFNPLKILIMIAPIVIITATFLFFNSNTDESLVGEDLKAETGLVTDTNNLREKVNKEPANVIELKQQSLKKSLPAAISQRIPAEIAKPIEKDTAFSGIILDLSKEELQRLGFMFDEEGYYYLNKLPDGSMVNFWSFQMQLDKQVVQSGSNFFGLTITGRGGSAGFASGGLVNKANKSKLNEFDFYPVLTTDLNGEDLYPIEQIKAKVYFEFELMNDTLVPVLFSPSKFGGYQTGDKLIWFKVSEQFFDLIKNGQSEQSRLIYTQVKALNKGHLPSNRVDYHFPDLLSLGNAIRVKPDVLKCMGINYTSTAIEINARAIEYWFKMDLNIVDGGTSVSWGMTRVNPIRSEADTLLPTSESIVLLGISNFGDIKMVDMPTRFYRQLNRKNLTFQQYLNLCIPVMMDSSGFEETGKEVIFWIYPNERFFNCLPPEIAGPMKKEFDYHVYESYVITESMPIFQVGTTKSRANPKDSIMPSVEPVPCVYYTNLCETLSGLDYVNLYPNPATDKLNIDLLLQSAKRIQFRVFDLGGRVISEKEAPKDFPAGGQYKHQLDISKLQGGLYLLVMTDAEGARLTRRFIKN